MHVLGRIDHIPMEESSDRAIKSSELLAYGLTLIGELEKRAKACEKSREIPPQLGSSGASRRYN